MRLRTISDDASDYAEQEATPDAVRTAFYQEEIPYGAEVELLPEEDSQPCLTAISVTGPFARLHDPGEFLLVLNEGGTTYTEASERCFTREAAFAYFLWYLAGDHSWLQHLAWAEIINNKRTGRFRPRAP